MSASPSDTSLTTQGSLVRRMVVAALSWALVLLVLGALALTALFRQTVLRELEDRLSGTADSLIAHVEISDTLVLRLDEDLLDPRFSQTFSGRYWQVGLTDVQELAPLTSQSLGDVFIRPPLPAVQEATREPGIAVVTNAKGPDGEPLRVILRAILLEGVEGPLLVMAAEDMRPANQQIMRFGLTAAGLFFLFILVWILTNTLWLFTDKPFDPYPFILLNLGLSSLAAFQAPIIMMSQNRQSAKDRIKQDAAYEINLKLELEMMRLHEKIDHLQSGEKAV